MSELELFDKLNPRQDLQQGTCGVSAQVWNVMIETCCLCKKALFINGERQVDLCYQLGLYRKRILKDGSYADGSDSRIFICKACFTRNNNDIIMEALWKEHEITKQVRKARGEEWQS